MKVLKNLITYLSVTAMSFLMFGNVAMAVFASIPSGAPTNSSGTQYDFGVVQKGDVLSSTFVLGDETNSEINNDVYVYLTHYPVDPNNYFVFPNINDILSLDDYVSNTFYTEENVVNIDFSLTIPENIEPGHHRITIRGKFFDADAEQQNGISFSVAAAKVINFVIEEEEEVEEEEEEEVVVEEEDDEAETETDSNSNSKYIGLQNLKLEKKYPFNPKKLSKSRYRLNNYILPVNEEEDDKEENDNENNDKKKKSYKNNYKKINRYFKFRK